VLARAHLACAEQPVIALTDLAAHHAGLVLLVGGCDGLVQRLLVAGRLGDPRAVLARSSARLGVESLRMERRYMLLPESGLALICSALLAADMGVAGVATNGARDAVRDDHAVYDLLTCVRLGLRVDEPHPERPYNAEQHLMSAAELRPLFAECPDALANAADLAAACQVELLAPRCVPLRVLLRKLRGKILIIWDGSPIHKGQPIKDLLQRGAAKRLHLERLPGYAPDLNPDEGIWNYLKRVELKNRCCRDLAELRVELRRATGRLRHKRDVIRGCSAQCGYSV
jgi:DNA polymerase III alpha subunit